ncbi:ATP-binding response regulator [Actibacterium pelagium]|nr:ATP-binding protein [Actibacterium pelagium]
MALRCKFRRFRVDVDRISDALLTFDPSPCIVASYSGQVIYANPAARDQFKIAEVDHLSHSLGLYFANVDKVFNEMTDAAIARGIAEVEAAVASAERMMVRALRMNGSCLLWRFDKLPTDQELGAIWELPMLRADDDGVIRYLNRPARTLLRGQPIRVDEIADRGLEPGLQELKIRNARKFVTVIKRPAERGGAHYLLAPIDRPEPMKETADSLIDGLPVAILKIELGGRIDVVNQVGRDLLGLTPGEHFFQDHVEGLGRPVKEWVNEVIETDHGASSEVLRVRREDREVFVQVSLRRSLFPEDQSAIAVLHDATEMKQLEAQFNQSQKMQAIGELAGGVAHDFNNLLTAISGHCDLLLLRRDEGHPDYGDLMQIHQNANRAAALVEQLLAFSRKQNLRPQKVGLRDALQDLGHLLDRLVGATVKLTVHHDSADASIWVDRRQFEQVIMNLVVNARDAMPNGGEIQISTSVRKLVRDLHRNRAKVPAGDYVVISVEDQGEGIPAEQIDKIFDPFFTTKPQGKGTGLGLSMAYGIVKQSGGFIFVDSNTGEGTRFYLYFPVRRGSADCRPNSLPQQVANRADEIDIGLTESFQRVEETRLNAKAAPEERRQILSSTEAGGQGAGIVLLVEDEASVRAFAARALSMRGFTVLEAESAEQALDVLAVTTVPIDLFVTDVVMPGDDGPTWVRKARETYPDTRVVFMSGYTEEAFTENKGDLPNSVFIQKPFSLADFTKTVKQQVEISKAD